MAKPPAHTWGIRKTDLYSGFNLLGSDGKELWWMSNRGGGEPRRLEPGIYGLGNTLLDSPEVEPIKRPSPPSSSRVPRWKPLFTCSGSAHRPSLYGTRCSTILLSGERTRYAERAFAADGADGETLHYEF